MSTSHFTISRPAAVMPLIIRDRARGVTQARGSLKPKDGTPWETRRTARGIAAHVVLTILIARYRTAAWWSEMGSFARPECDGSGRFADRARRENRTRGSNRPSDDPREADKRDTSRRTTGILDDARRSTAPLPGTSHASHVRGP